MIIFEFEVFSLSDGGFLKIAHCAPANPVSPADPPATILKTPRRTAGREFFIHKTPGKPPAIAAPALGLPADFIFKNPANRRQRRRRAGKMRFSF